MLTRNTQARLLTLAVTISALLGGLVLDAQAGTAGSAAGYQMSAAHDGQQTDGTLTPPLAQHWQRDLAGTVSYPVIVDGIAYVTVTNATSSSYSYGTKLYALDVATGNTVWGPVDLGGLYSFSAVTYDAGMVFAVNYNGVLRAFDASNGTGIWTTQLPGQYSFTSPPTALNGLVYTGGAGNGGTLYAVHESDGTVAWTASVANGDHSSPAVTSTGVYVSYACNQAYDFDPATGALVWHHTSYCSGGGGKTVAVRDGRVYTRDWSGNLILDAQTGAELGTYSATPIPAFDTDNVFTLNGSSLSAEDASGTIHWTFTGDGALDSAPIVDNGYIYVGSGKGNLYAVRASDGTAVWSTNVGHAITAPDEQNATLLTGLAASGDMLLVPSGSVLTAFGQAPPSIAAHAIGTLGSNGWYTSDVTVHFTCTAGSYPIASCPSDVTLTKQGAAQVVNGTVTDAVGETATTSISVSIDESAPSVDISSSSLQVNRAVQGTAHDRISGVGSVAVTFTSTLGTATEQATLTPCSDHNPGCMAWSASPPAGLLGSGTGGNVWSGVVSATVTDVAGLTASTADTSQTIVG